MSLYSNVPPQFEYIFYCWIENGMHANNLFRESARNPDLCTFVASSLMVIESWLFLFFLIGEKKAKKRRQ